MYCRYQNNDQSVSLIPKQDPGIPRITNFSIPDHYIPAMTPAPVSLVLSDPRSVCRFLDIFNLIFSSRRRRLSPCSFSFVFGHLMCRNLPSRVIDCSWIPHFWYLPAHVADISCPHCFSIQQINCLDFALKKIMKAIHYSQWMLQWLKLEWSQNIALISKSKYVNAILS